MSRVQRFNRVARAMGRAALEHEAALAVVYGRAVAQAGRFYVDGFEREAVVAAADWVPPSGTEEFDSATALAAAREQRELAAAAVEAAFASRAGEIGISWDPDRFRVYHPDLLESLGQHAASNFTASMRDALAVGIRESFDAGLSVPDTAKALRSRFSDLSSSAATMLARTDLISLANGGAFMAAQQVFERGEVGKEWHNAHDARVRPSHASAGGQVVPLEAPFSVGGFDLLYPGDPQGPPSEVINCRCTFTVTDAAVTAAADTMEGAMAVGVGAAWRSLLVLEGVETDDGRLIEPGALDWRDLPLSLMAMTETGPGGHEGAEVAGRIDQIARLGSEVIGEGVFDGGEFGSEIERLVREEMLRGVSVDLAIREYELRSEEGRVLEGEEIFEEERIIFAITDASILAATVCPMPAFADASIVLASADGEEDPSRATILMPFTLRSMDEPLAAEVEALAIEDAEEGLAAGALGEALRSIFADTVTMESTARGYHFVAQVPQSLFEAMYRDLSSGAGRLAEMMLAVGARPPISLAEISELRSIGDGSDAVAVFDMAAGLRQQNEAVLSALNAAYTVAVAGEQPGVADVLSKRIERHQRWAVQLRGLMAA